MSKYLHFAVNISIQSILLLLSYYAALGLYQHYFDATLNEVPMYLSFLSVFLTVYFALMWKDLYAHDVHSYLLASTSIISKNLTIAVLPVLSLIMINLIFADYLKIVHFKVIIFFGFAIFTILGMHLLYYLWLKSLSFHGYFHKKVMLVGRSNSRFHVERFFQDMGKTKDFCGTLRIRDKTPETYQAKQEPIWIWEHRPTWKPDYIQQRHPELEYYQDFMDVVYRHHIGELVIFLGSQLSEDILQHITNICDEHAIGYYIVPDLSSLPHTKHWDKVFSYIPIIANITTQRDDLFAISIKRLFDIGVSLLVLLLFLPLGLVISLLIFLTDFGPVFYISKRVGKDGQIIPFFKFRSMHRDAEQMKAKLFALNERDGPLFKIKHDPRVTRIGRFLRHTSLDEFPQFVNVLLGHLSIIGPRPHLSEEMKSYIGKDFMRLECMPGITCLPQLHDRNHMDFHQWINFDLHYRKNWTLRLDFYIFWKTSLLFLKSFVSVKEDSFSP